MNYSDLLQAIRDKALACGRNPDEITLITVSKTRPWSLCQPLYAAGCRHFGENRPQEALEKIPQAPIDIHWHLIGTLQRNKVNKVVGKFSLIHSVDTLPLAEKLSQASQQAGLITSILIQINTSQEPSKHGLDPALIPTIRSLPHLDVQGLMTIGPLTDDAQAIRHAFRSLRSLKEQHNLTHLSMGMSQDWPLAIEEGATYLRIGSALF